MNLHQKQKHPEYVEGCFGCKVTTLELGTGDATRDISDKKWNSELQAYRDAKSQGIQPGGTSRAHVEAAYAASVTLGWLWQEDGSTRIRYGQAWSKGSRQQGC